MSLLEPFSWRQSRRWKPCAWSRLYSAELQHPFAVLPVLCIVWSSWQVVAQVNRVYSSYLPHYRLLLIGNTVERSVLDLHIICCLEFPWQCGNSSKPITRFSEDLDLFLRVDSVYLARQHLRYQYLQGEVLWYIVRIQYFICTAGKRLFYVIYNHTSLPIQQLFLSFFSSSLSLSFPLWLADKKMAIATVFPETAIVSWASVEGRLKIISSGAIRNGGRRQNIHPSLLLNCYPATLLRQIKVMPLATPVSIYAIMLT